jgi:hypothetical protein
MRSLGCGITVAVLAAICGSVAIAQGTPAVPQPAAELASASLPPALVGTWDAITRSHGGLGQTALFAPDHTVALVLGAMVDMKYKLEGDKLTVYSDNPRDRFSQTNSLTLVGDTAIILSRGNSLRMVRLPTSNPVSGLVGGWRYMHYTGVPGYDEYAQDGSMRLRVPIQVQRGLYSVAGNKISFLILAPAREEWDAEFAITGDTLSVQARGQKHLYLRARPLIPYDVRQPRPDEMKR